MIPLQINLYSTSHCHLCEQAEAMLLTLTEQVEYTYIEISDSLNLIDEYGIKIPVLKRLDSGIELSWPFTLEDIENFLSAR